MLFVKAGEGLGGVLAGWTGTLQVGILHILRQEGRTKMGPPVGIVS